jgi:hypothetical protein
MPNTAVGVIIARIRIATSDFLSSRAHYARARARLRHLGQGEFLVQKVVTRLPATKIPLFNTPMHLPRLRDPG